jgi:O-antigen ligase
MPINVAPDQLRKILLVVGMALAFASAVSRILAIAATILFCLTVFFYMIRSIRKPSKHLRGTSVENAVVSVSSLAFWVPIYIFYAVPTVRQENTIFAIIALCSVAGLIVLVFGPLAFKISSQNKRDGDGL